MHCKSFLQEGIRGRASVSVAGTVLVVLLVMVLSAMAQDNPTKVDVELVLGADVSRSMDHEEQRIQRDGYSAAFRAKDVIEAILGGHYGRVAVAYVEWAGATDQVMAVPWTLIDSPAASKRFAAALSVQEPLRLGHTSISGVIDFARRSFDNNGFEGTRRIIDISGDGPNNDGAPVQAARDAAVALGMTINGLPLMTNIGDVPGGFALDQLDSYYADCVIGGDHAFVLPVTNWRDFPKALRRKLVLELASGPGSMPGGPLPVVRVQAKHRLDCEIGDKLWQQRLRLWDEP